MFQMIYEYNNGPCKYLADNTNNSLITFIHDSVELGVMSVPLILS